MENDVKNSNFLTKEEFYNFVEKELCTRAEIEELISKLEKSFSHEILQLRLDIKDGKIALLQWGLPFMFSIISLLFILLFKM